MKPSVRLEARAAALLLLPLALTGCGGKGEAAFQGTWKVDPAFASTMSAKASAQNPAAAAQTSILAKVLGSTSLDLKEDKTFKYATVIALEGPWKWNSENNSVTLTATKMSGTVTLPKPVNLTGTLDENSRLHLVAEGPSSAQELVFVKE